MVGDWTCTCLATAFVLTLIAAPILGSEARNLQRREHADALRNLLFYERFKELDAPPGSHKGDPARNQGS